MSFQFEQLAQLLAFVALAVAFWKLKNLKARVAIGAIAAVLFLVNPFRGTVPSVSTIERGGPDFTLPDRVTVDRPSFKERQEQEFNALKSQSKEARDDATH